MWHVRAGFIKPQGLTLPLLQDSRLPLSRIFCERMLMASRALLVASLLGVRALGALYQGPDESLLNKTYDVIVVGGGCSIRVSVFTRY